MTQFQKRHSLCLVVYAAALLPQLSHADPSANGPVMQVEGGKIAGSIQDGVASFKGIPFAAPADGANRWRAPQPVSPWQGVRDASNYGADCQQTPFPGDEAPLRTAMSEDCLFLNIWKPAQAKAGAKLPVVVWIYGGAYMTGGTSPAIYDGSAFARKDVVAVSFNYRVGRFGFFYHPSLAAEQASPSGNFALMDHVAALQWVRNNIAQFGGDPDRVTIMGESAGGTSVISLIAMPAAQNLFQQAIAMSGGGRSLFPIPDRQEAEKIGINFARKVGIADNDANTLEKLRALPVDVVRGSSLFSELGFSGPKTYMGGQMADETTIVGSSDTLMEAGKVRHVPIMIGMTSGDAGVVMAQNKEDYLATFGKGADAIRKAYDPDGTLDFKTLSWKISRDQYMSEPARFVARHAVKAGKRAYIYNFGYVAQSKRSAWVNGAPHATDIPYFFNTVAARYGEATTPLDAKAADLTNAYVVNFIRTGNPNGRGLPEWSAYRPGTEKLLTITMDATAHSAKDSDTARLDTIEAAAVLPAR